MKVVARIFLIWSIVLFLNLNFVQAASFPKIEGKFLNYTGDKLESLSLEIEWNEMCAMRKELTCKSGKVSIAADSNGNYSIPKLKTSRFFRSLVLRIGIYAGKSVIASLKYDSSVNESEPYAYGWRRKRRYPVEMKTISIYKTGRLPVNFKLKSGTDINTWVEEREYLELPHFYLSILSSDEKNKTLGSSIVDFKFLRADFNGQGEIPSRLVGITGDLKENPIVDIHGTIFRLKFSENKKFYYDREAKSVSLKSGIEKFMAEYEVDDLNPIIGKLAE